MTNKQIFQAALQKNYTKLFVTPEYAYSAKVTTPEILAEKMTNSLANNTANKDGAGIKNTCKELGIKYTYTEIQQFLSK